jgi:hypothetical protein
MPAALTVAQVDKLATACDLSDRVLVLLLAYGSGTQRARKPRKAEQ